MAGVSVDLILDSNFNGGWDAGEPIIATTTTDSALVDTGNYYFTVPQSPPTGDYYLVHVSDTNAVLINYVKSVLGSDPNADNHNRDDPYAITLPGTNNLFADFGYVKIDRPNTSVIGNQMWIESESNGLFSSLNGDVGQPGVTVDLFKDTEPMVQPRQAHLATTASPVYLRATTGWK